MTYESMLAETIAFRGHKGDVGEAYYARPLGGGPLPGVVRDPSHAGWDEWTNEVVRKFAHHGYAAIAPHLYLPLRPRQPRRRGRARARAAGGACRRRR